MAFKYGTTSPTAIKYNGTDLTVLKYGTTAVWGKPYSLSISAGSNTTVTVTRTSSPNQHASTGTLSSGSVVYYGDVLTISYSVSSGYKINTATVNGTTFTSGQSFTVTSAISVVTTAVASASWHTVWSGVTSTWISATSAYTISDGSWSLNKSYPTRISGIFSYYDRNYDFLEYNYNYEQLPFSVTKTDGADSGFGTIAFNGVQSSTSISYTYTMNGYDGVGITITLIQQYY